MTIREAARRAGVSERTMRRRIAQGLLGCRRDGGRVVVSEGDLATYLARRKSAERRRMGLPEPDWGHVRELFPGLFTDNGLPRRARRTRRTARTEVGG